MLYLLIGLLQRITFRLFFRHIHVANFKYIPYNKPVVIACNHPGAFMDPGFIGSIMRKPVYFTSRGDVFANPIASWFLHGLHIKPIFRLEEGFGNLSKNFETIEILTDILKKNGIVVIFSEGLSALDRRLRPLRKGTARIFLQIEREHNLGIQLYASGITYTHKTNFRKSILYSIGKPLFLKDYLTDYISHPQRGYHTFTKELAHRIRENFVVVPHPECDLVVDQHINYYCSTERDFILPVVIYNRNKLNDLQALSRRINHIFQSDKEKFEQLQNVTNMYEEALVNHQISDYGLMNKPLNLFHFILLILALPLSIPGFYFWGIPYLIAKKIADKTVTRIDFYDSVSMNSLALIYGVLTVINNIILAFFIGWWSLLIYVIAPVLGEFCFWTYDALSHHVRAQKASRCGAKEELRAMRNRVVDLNLFDLNPSA
jgi:glycerol-3-phosphate O-acyltransferase/dihydroxyacetone phosphate acyltransferase